MSGPTVAKTVFRDDKIRDAGDVADPVDCEIRANESGAVFRELEPFNRRV